MALSDALFSKVQQRVLALIFGQPDRSFYTLEIVRAVDSGVGAVTRELSKLRSSGLVSVEHIGNQVHYRANESAPIYEDLRSLVAKTVGLKDVVGQSLKPHGAKLTAAFIFGSVAKGIDTAASDVDLMVVGDDLDYADLYAAIQGVETRLARKVNALFVSVADWRRKISDKGSVFDKISRSPKIFVVGAEKDLRDAKGRT